MAATRGEEANCGRNFWFLIVLISRLCRCRLWCIYAASNVNYANYFTLEMCIYVYIHIYRTFWSQLTPLNSIELEGYLRKNRAMIRWSQIWLPDTRDWSFDFQTRVFRVRVAGFPRETSCRGERSWTTSMFSSFWQEKILFFASLKGYFSVKRKYNKTLKTMELNPV